MIPANVTGRLVRLESVRGVVTVDVKSSTVIR